ncbi:putative membrane protein [Arthrobacter sp. V1I9]|uniref:hypothetical protein n=1 Tax=Arthrobacter sp. V1I9 TaxID=3042275 RepID=UPI0027947F8F|nr:hypothetical protein [Arthrobacter sp. V1I9]MDQ0869065.1 putative membrane protein [Arthrobacter sp. V1I9]
MNISTAVALSLSGGLSDAEGMAMLTGVFVFLIVMFLLLFVLTWAIVSRNRKQAKLNRAVYDFYSRQFKGASNDVKAWWKR